MDNKPYLFRSEDVNAGVFDKDFLTFFKNYSMEIVGNRDTPIKSKTQDGLIKEFQFEISYTETP